MPSLVRVGVAGTGSYAPAKVVPNQWFESFLDTSDEWIVQRSGIRNRRFAAPDEATSDLCIQAAKPALEAAGIGPEDLDLIVVGTLTPDYPLPSTAVLVQDRLGAKRAAAFDVSAACTGFMTALHVGESFIATGRARYVLAIGAEVLSRFLDLKDRTSCILFGDAAGAVVLAPWNDVRRGELLKGTLGADGSQYELIHIRGNGSRHPTSPQTLDLGEQYIRLRGREVFKFAVSTMSELILQMLEGYSPDELGLIVPHQVNRRIIDAALDRIGMTDEKVVVNIQHYGNTSAATVPLALDEAVREGRMVDGKLVVLVAFGAGMTWGASLLRW